MAKKKKSSANLLKSIRLLVLDVDGVLTDGGMYYTESGDEFKKFNAKDGIAVKQLVKAGVPVALLSSGINKNIIRNRAERLEIKYFHCGLEPKTQILEAWRKELNIEYKQIAYIGDDVNDLEVISQCGFSFCPADAVSKVRKAVDVVLKKKGGDGCVREMIERYFISV